MARKSAAALATVVVDPLGRPAAPATMSKAQREQWDAIVRSVPADFFRPCDHALLEAYCCAAVLHRDACRVLEAEGFLQDGGNGPIAHPAVAVVKQCASSLASLAPKLRLCPSSRLDGKKAETVTRPVEANLWQRRSVA